MNTHKLSQTLCRTLTIVNMGGVTIQELRVKFPARKTLIIAGILLLLLAVVDSFFTDFGIQKQYITEANPLMAFIYDTSILGFYALKISLPCVLLYLLTKIEPKEVFKTINRIHNSTLQCRSISAYLLDFINPLGKEPKNRHHSID